MENGNYTKIDRSISMLKANIISFALLPLLVIPFALFLWLWDTRRLLAGLAAILDRPLFLVIGFVLLIVAHELIHGLTWQLLSGRKGGKVVYGFQWKTVTPYAHIKGFVDIRTYRWGAAMPGLVLGVLPLLIGLLIGNGAWLSAGAFMTYAASGDMMILFLIRDVKPPAQVEDHPTDAGCYVLVPEK